MLAPTSVRAAGLVLALSIAAAAVIVGGLPTPDVRHPPSPASVAGAGAPASAPTAGAAGRTAGPPRAFEATPVSQPVYDVRPPDADPPRAFEATPVSQPVYDVRPPDADPARQRHVVVAADGTELFTETWLPVAREGGQAPPARIPTVLTYTPYAVVGQPGGTGASARILEPLVRRGYAVTQAHVRGTGASGGCFQLGGPVEQDDGARIVEYLGRDAPWSNGRVGMQGLSYEGGTQFTVATSPDRDRVQYLRAIVPSAPNVSAYAFVMADGAPFWMGPELIYGLGQGVATSFGAFPSRGDYVADRAPRGVEHIASRAGCPPLFQPWTEGDGDFSTFWAERETRLHLDRVSAAVLLSHGIPDRRVSVASVSGVLTELPRTTPWAGVFGWWQHGAPDDRPHEGWGRTDWEAMVVAWFDRYLKDLPSGVERWPRVQVQGSDGRWRAETTWPRPDGEFGQLALAANGRLGAGTTAGSSSYVEEPFATALAPQDPTGTSVVFETAPLDGALEVTGEPVLDLWLTVDQPAASIPAKLEALGPDGQLTIGEAVNVGIRSVRHLQPLHRGAVFVQPAGVDPPLSQPFRVQVRLRPTHLVVPEGGRLRLTIGGSPGVNDVPEELGLAVEGPTEPSGRPTRITILHDCAHPSVLRFTVPRLVRWLDVRGAEGPGPGAVDTGAPRSHASGAGLASGPVCGHPPAMPYAAL